ncbi:MAG: TIM barrel protein [Geminicoccaceae bacterium]|nr:TIM barrel protein [Geminicoccaceae bacterium]
MSFTLSLNTNPLVNRFAEPDDLIETIARDIRIERIQLTHEFVDPAWPASVVARHVRAYRRALDRTGVKITSIMTGPYGRLNHFGHPDADVRAHSVRWFCTLADIAAELGAPVVGTQFAILTLKDFRDPHRREAMIEAALEGWRTVARHALDAGLTWLLWEPMSVGREFGETLVSCRALQQRIDAAGLALPLEMMIDIDHGDVTSSDPADYDPFAWARTFAADSPIIHIKQSSMTKSGHAPFTAAHNRGGRITPASLLPVIREGGGYDNEICLELSFREREPTDGTVVEALAESVAFWAGDVDTGASRLKVQAR